ncbi:MAG: hypothetical protein ACXV2E_09170, partial [Halobacteriota archaeon]
ALPPTDSNSNRTQISEESSWRLADKVDTSSCETIFYTETDVKCESASLRAPLGLAWLHRKTVEHLGHFIEQRTLVSCRLGQVLYRMKANSIIFIPF